MIAEMSKMKEQAARLRDELKEQVDRFRDQKHREFEREVSDLFHDKIIKAAESGELDKVERIVNERRQCLSVW